MFKKNILVTFHWLCWQWPSSLLFKHASHIEYSSIGVTLHEVISEWELKV